MFNDIAGTWLFDSLLTFLLFSFSVSLFSNRDCIVFCITLWCGSAPLLHAQQYFDGVMCARRALSSIRSTLRVSGPIVVGRPNAYVRNVYTHILPFSLPFIRVHDWPHPIRFILPVVHFYMFIYGIVGLFISSLLFFFWIAFSTLSSSSSNLHCLVVLVDLIRFDFCSFPCDFYIELGRFCAVHV